ncbi:MAG: hypothetical protein IJ660_05340 [Alphaproteobacteria bacterium]|nr:hypothetical protein [Alphaproteobacteria bacterium]
MEVKIKNKSQEWKSAIACECVNFLPSGESAEDLPVFEQLKLIFDDEVGQETDETFRRRVVKEYNLHVTVEKGDLPHLSPTVKDALELCEEIAKKLPNDFMQDLNIKSIKKSKYGFAKRGEQAVFQVFHNCNAAIIELQVRTETEREEELVYWSKDKLFLLSFVPELDEEHSISMAQNHLFSL